MITLFVGAGYTGARVLAQLPEAGTATQSQQAGFDSSAKLPPTPFGVLSCTKPSVPNFEF